MDNLDAVDGNTAEAIEAAETSRQLRQKAGGRYFQVVNRLIIGSAYVHLKRPVEAEKHLKAAIAESKQLGESYMQGVHLLGSAAYFRENLLQQYHKSVLRRIDILILHQRIDEAVRIAEKALPVDPTHEPLSNPSTPFWPKAGRR
jgi:tetratricopeptide (TPR) repeat protein